MTPIEKQLQSFLSLVNIDGNFDLIHRRYTIGGRKTSLFFVDGLTKDHTLERILAVWKGITPEEINDLPNLEEFIANHATYIEITTETDYANAVKFLLSGMSVIIIDGFDGVLLMDTREYPVRSIAEPDRERTVRGAKDCFVETIVFNTALIRRRIRMPELTFEIVDCPRGHTDVAIGYLSGKADPGKVEMVRKKISKAKLNAAINQQNIADILCPNRWYDALPSFKTTERPDVAVAEILEGNIIVIVDNIPFVLVVPTTLFDFIQDPSDFQTNVLIANCRRFVRVTGLVVAWLLPAVWIMLVRHADQLPPFWQILVPKEDPKIPILLQFIVFEFLIDSLKIASANTPSALSSAFNIVAVLAFGDLAITTELVAPHVILLMSVVIIGSMEQISMELLYAVKLGRMLLYTLTWFFTGIGAAVGFAICVLVLLTHRTITGYSYLYPLIPWDGHKLYRIFVKSRKNN